VLLVDKPRGPTSHDVVAAVRSACGERRVGHAGTLDPIAEGLLVICVGKATRIAEYLAGHEKVYLVDARLGVETSTYDAEGEVLAARDHVSVTDDDISEVLARFLGEIDQVPPRFSAIKVGGQPAHRLARAGRRVDLPARKVTIYDLDWERLSASLLRLRVRCSAGTYVRSLVHDVGQQLGTGAHVVRLKRLQAGPHNVRDALPLEGALQRLRAGDWSVLLDLGSALSDMPRVLVDEENISRLLTGQRVPGPEPRVGGAHLAVDCSGQVVAVIHPTEDGLWQPRKVFGRGERLV